MTTLEHGLGLRRFVAHHGITHEKFHAALLGISTVSLILACKSATPALSDGGDGSDASASDAATHGGSDGGLPPAVLTFLSYIATIQNGGTIPASASQSP